MKIEISSTEKHPIPSGIFRDEETPQHLVVIFGLAKARGDNMIFSTRVTDAFYDVLKKYGFGYLGAKDLAAHMNAKSAIQTGTLNFDTLGIPYNVRQIMNPQQYTGLVNDLCASIDTVEIPVTPTGQPIPPSNPPNAPHIAPPEAYGPRKTWACRGCGVRNFDAYAFCPKCGAGKPGPEPETETEQGGQ